MADCRLDTEAVERGAINPVVVQTVNQQLIHSRLIGQDAVNHALIQVGRSESPHFAGKVNIVAVMNFR